MRSKLTEITLKSLRTDCGQLEVFDTHLPSFGVRITSRGTKTFFVAYRVNGKQRRYSLGRWPDISLGKARDKARQAILIVRGGGDPQRVAGTDRSHGKPSFNSFIDDFVAKHCKPRNRTWRETERLLKREFASQWGLKPIHRVTRGDIQDALDVIIERGCPTLANNALVAIRKLFNWALEKGHLESSPCERIRAPAPVITRDRVLSDHEIKLLWNATSFLPCSYRELVRLLLLTAQRRAEVAEAGWSEINLPEASWVIPGDRTKNGKTHTLPLSSAAVKILTDLPHTHEHLVFPARDSENPISGFAKWKAELDKRSGVVNWRLHDLRRTAASNMARLKVPPHVIEKILNHSSGTLGGVAGIYNRHGYLDEMREAMQLWGQRLDDLTRL